MLVRYCRVRMPPFARSFRPLSLILQFSLWDQVCIFKHLILPPDNYEHPQERHCSLYLAGAGRQHTQHMPSVRSSSQFTRFTVNARSNGQPPGSGSGQYSSGKGERTEVVPVPANRQAPAFGSLERQIASNLTTAQPGLRDDWREVLGCWVLGPPAAAGAPQS